jgi:hypothetical protein
VLAIRTFCDSGPHTIHGDQRLKLINKGGEKLQKTTLYLPEILVCTTASLSLLKFMPSAQPHWPRSIFVNIRTREDGPTPDVSVNHGKSDRWEKGKLVIKITIKPAVTNTALAGEVRAMDLG